MAEPGTLIGLVMLAVASYATAFLALWKQPRAIKLFAAALITVSLGYLATTQVPVTLARATLGEQR